MSWPTPAEINEAIQNPQLSFKDQDLSEGKPETDANGIPVARSGSNADVYCFHCATERVAVKCFTRPIAHLEQRYQAVHNALSNLQLPFTVDFSYRSEGLWLRDQWYPLVRMQWVDGIRLNEFAQSRIDRPEVLQNLIEILAKMNDWLDVNQVAHCDLQHGNILLIPHSDSHKLSVRLVDYDGMWVPALANEPAQEFGHPDYQHPERMARSYSGPAVDRFSLLAIATGLRALIAHGQELWQRYDNTVNIVFQQKDFADPHHSPLFEELGRSPDEALRRLCGTLAEACTHRIEDVPHLSDVLKSIAKSGTRRALSGEETSGEWEGLGESQKTDDSARPKTPKDAQTDNPARSKKSRTTRRASDSPAINWKLWRWPAVSLCVLLIGLIVLWSAGAFARKSRAKIPAESTPTESADRSGSNSSTPTKTAPAAEKKTKTPWQKARTVHANAIKDANTRLLQHFDRIIQNLANENNGALMNTVESEKKRFVEKGMIPWSEPMWPHCQSYLQAIQQAEEELETSWNTELTRASKANEELIVRSLPGELTEASVIKVVARWRHQPGNGPGGPIDLYSNGKIGNKSSPHTWSLQPNNVLVLKWLNKQAPGGSWIDRCQVSRDGKNFNGTNQIRSRITGGNLAE